MIATVQKKKTFKDLEKIDSPFCYLLEGEIFMVPAPIPEHQDVSRNIEFLLLQFVKKKKLGKIYNSPIDVYFDEYNTLQPDILFISKKRLSIIKKKKIEGAPDLVMEILSENNPKHDLTVKKDIYAKYGVKEYWILDPLEKSIIIYQNKGGVFELISQAKKGNIASKLLSGFSVSLSEVFEDF